MLHRFILSLILCNASTSWAGAWGTGSFENDSALDWVSENITDTTSLNTISITFAATQTNNYLDIDDCSSAIAAAEIVASLNTNQFDNLPKAAASWARNNKYNFTRNLVLEALESINICSDDNKSELAQLWRGPLLEEWKTGIARIKAGLK